jgi:hypothetical protein
MAGIFDRLKKRVIPQKPQELEAPKVRDDLPPAARTPSGLNIAFNVGDEVEFSATDGSGVSHALQTWKYRALEPGQVTVRDGAIGRVAGIADQQLMIRLWPEDVNIAEGALKTREVQHLQQVSGLDQRYIFAFKRDDVMNLAEPDQRKWGARRAAMELLAFRPRPQQRRLVELAQKFPSYEQFAKAWKYDGLRGQYWHVTDQQNFEVDGTRALTATNDLDHWAGAYPDRQFAAELDLSAGDFGTHYKNSTAGFGHTLNVEPGAPVGVRRVMPLKNALRSWRRFHRLEPKTDTELRQLWEFAQSHREAQYAQGQEREDHIANVQRIYELEYKLAMLGRGEQPLPQRAYQLKPQWEGELSRLLDAEIAYLSSVVDYWLDTHTTPLEYDQIHEMLSETGVIWARDNQMQRSRRRVVLDLREEIALALQDILAAHIKQVELEDDPDEDTDDLSWIQSDLEEALANRNWNAIWGRALGGFFGGSISTRLPATVPDMMDQAIWSALFGSTSGGADSEAVQRRVQELYEQVNRQPANARILQVKQEMQNPPADIGGKLRLFHIALTTAHNNGPLATRAYGRGAMQTLTNLSAGPNPAWDAEVKNLLSMPRGAQQLQLPVSFVLQAKFPSLQDAAKFRRALMTDDAASISAFMPNQAAQGEVTIKGTYRPTSTMDENYGPKQIISGLVRGAGGQLVALNLNDGLTRTAEDEEAVKQLTWHGLEIAIEHEAGGVRHPEGPHPSFVPYDYGFFIDTTATDGDSVDAIVGGEDDVSGEVYLIVQKDPETGDFTQFKCFLNFPSAADAEAAMRLMWPDFMIGTTVTVPVPEFVELVLPKLDVGEPEEGEDDMEKTARDKAREQYEGAQAGDTCPHCNEVMEPKSFFGPPERRFHKPCVGKGPFPFAREAQADDAAWYRARGLELYEIAIDGQHYDKVYATTPPTAALSAARDALATGRGKTAQVTKDGQVIAQFTRGAEVRPNSLYRFDVIEEPVGPREAHVMLEVSFDDLFESRVAELHMGQLDQTADFDQEAESKEEKRKRKPRWKSQQPAFEEDEGGHPSRASEPVLPGRAQEELAQGSDEARYAPLIQKGMWPEVPLDVLLNYLERPWGAAFWQWLSKTPAGEKWQSSAQGSDFLIALEGKLGDDTFMPNGDIARPSGFKPCPHCQAMTSGGACWKCNRKPTERIITSTIVTMEELLAAAA